jgi:formamidopyrimidine-DNA glycosylase
VPELPEVEVLVRCLGPLLQGRVIQSVEIRRRKVLAPTSPRTLTRALTGAEFMTIVRRGKYLVFSLRKNRGEPPLFLLGHLGMTGRIYLAPSAATIPKHAAVILRLGRGNVIFEDTRYFGRFTLDRRALGKLGPEPLGAEFTAQFLAHALKQSRQPIKLKLLDQSIAAGVGNIYASEALFRAGICPRTPACGLADRDVRRLWRAVREVLRNAIKWGSTVPLDYAGIGSRDGLFYFGRAADSSDFYTERLQVYDRAGQPCPNCGAIIQRLVQSARSTYYCPACQPG